MKQNDAKIKKIASIVAAGLIVTAIAGCSSLTGGADGSTGNSGAASTSTEAATRADDSVKSGSNTEREANTESKTAGNANGADNTNAASVAESTGEGLTLEVYNRIETGMTYDEVAGLIGAEPDSQSTMDLMGSEVLTCIWYGEGSVGANATIQFQDGTVTSKAQSGLDGDSQQASGGKLTLAVYNQIEIGMTYDDVVGLIGAEPDSQSTMDLMGSEIIACTWYGEGSAGANAMIQFQDGAVSAKSQAGLE